MQPSLALCLRYLRIAFVAARRGKQAPILYIYGSATVPVLSITLALVSGGRIHGILIYAFVVSVFAAVAFFALVIALLRTSRMLAPPIPARSSRSAPTHHSAPARGDVGLNGIQSLTHAVFFSVDNIP
jgi:hypothetical protein